MTAEQLGRLLRGTIETVCGSRERLPRDQPLTNAVGLRLAWEWARSEVGGHCALTLYAAPHETRRRTRLELARLEDGKDVGYQPYEFLSDVLVTMRTRRGVERAVVAAEIEAHAQHGVTYETCTTSKGYWWDLEKLLYVKAPRKLFLARCQTEKLGTLANTIERRWREMDRSLRMEEWALILLPAATTHVDRVVVASAAPGNDITFARCSAWDRGARRVA